MVTYVRGNGGITLTGEQLASLQVVLDAHIIAIDDARDGIGLVKDRSIVKNNLLSNRMIDRSERKK